MRKQERRKNLGLSVAGNVERYFVILQFAVLTMTMIYLLYLIFGTIHYELSRVEDWQTVDAASILDQISLLILIRTSVLFFVVFLINLFLGFFFLHRLTGPLTRIQTVLSQIGEGTVPSTEVVLRKGDFPTELAKALSQALRRIRQWQRLEQLDVRTGGT